MALISCPECKKEVSDQAAACPHCGYDLHKVEKEKKSEEKKSATQFGCLMAIIAFVAIIAVLASLPSHESSTHDSTDACLIAQKFVTDRLKSPSTADFGHCFDATITKLDSVTFGVSNWVDAENSFGAKIRTHFVCTVKWTGGDSWNLVDLKGI